MTDHTTRYTRRELHRKERRSQHQADRMLRAAVDAYGPDEAQFMGEDNGLEKSDGME